MTSDGLPLRDGEYEVQFEGHSLNWWRQKSSKDHQLDGNAPEDPMGLSKLLFLDWENHFGFPNRIRAKDMQDVGVTRLVTAIVRNITDDIVNTKVIELNDNRDLKKGNRIPAEAMKALIYQRERAEEDLKSERMMMYLMGADGDALVRESYNVAARTVRDFYRQQEKMISEKIRKSGVTIKELVAELRKLNIDDDEIPQWITHCTPQRENTIKKILKRLKKGEREDV